MNPNFLQVNSGLLRDPYTGVMFFAVLTGWVIFPLLLLVTVVREDPPMMTIGSVVTAFIGGLGAYIFLLHGLIFTTIQLGVASTVLFGGFCLTAFLGSVKRSNRPGTFGDLIFWIVAGLHGLFYGLFLVGMYLLNKLTPQEELILLVPSGILLAICSFAYFWKAQGAAEAGSLKLVTEWMIKGILLGLLAVAVLTSVL